MAPPSSSRKREWLSPDGQWRWDGTRWLPHAVQPPTAPGAGGVGGEYRPLTFDGTVSRPPAAPPGRRVSLIDKVAYQFGGDGLWSILFGVASVGVPLFTPVYFPIMPVFGLWRGFRAIGRGRIAGGVIGLVVSAAGGLVSLLVSGLVSSLPH